MPVDFYKYICRESVSQYQYATLLNYLRQVKTLQILPHRLYGYLIDRGSEGVREGGSNLLLCRNITFGVCYRIQMILNMPRGVEKLGFFNLVS